MSNNVQACDECGGGMGAYSMLKDRMYLENLDQRKIVVNETIDSNAIEKIVLPIMEFNAEDDELTAESKLYVRDNRPICVLLNSFFSVLFQCTERDRENYSFVQDSFSRSVTILLHPITAELQS